MINKKILIVSNYPVIEARDGGQKRGAAIVEEYSKVFKEVKSVAVFRGRYPKYQKDDIFVPSDGGWEGGLVPFVGDIIASEAIYNDPKVKAKMTRILKQFKPDIIQIEQTFPYMGLKPLLVSLGMQPTIILSSHNIEYSHKQEILQSLGVKPSVYRPVVEKIKQAEEAICKDAALVIAVTEHDMKIHRAMGAKNLVVAPNGIAKSIPSQKAADYWKNYCKKRSINHTVAFVGSAHPPNWVGFLQTVGEGVGFLPADTRLLLAGSISDYFQENFTDRTPSQITFWQRVIPIGRLSEDRLAGLIQNADVLILPITEGGGSNLKTAEAVLSGRKVVATSFAFRSFEQYQNLPNIYIADKPAEFRKAIIKAIDAPLIERTPSQLRLAEKVQWKHCLQPAVKGAAAL